MMSDNKYRRALYAGITIALLIGGTSAATESAVDEPAHIASPLTGHCHSNAPRAPRPGPLPTPLAGIMMLTAIAGAGVLVVNSARQSSNDKPKRR